MANYYVDHGAYASALGATPTWGVPQEGDGSSKDAATSSSIATITFSGVPSSGAISLCGASVSTTGVIGAASASAAATALAANINATTNAVSTTFCNSGAPTNVSRLQNIVFARVNPGSPTQVQVMTRVGSSTLNVTCWGSTLNNASVTEFSGGSGGCWGWLVNPSALGVSSSIAAVGYGVIVSTPIVWPQAITQDDVVWARTGNNPVITYSGTNFDLRRVVSTTSHPLNLVFDTNTQWTSDLANGVCTFNLTLSGSLGLPNVRAGSNNSNYAQQASSFVALRSGAVRFNVVSSIADLPIQVTSMANDGWSATSSTHHTTCGIEVVDNSTGSNSARLLMQTSGTGGGADWNSCSVYTDCRFVRSNSLAGLPVTRFALASSTNTIGKILFNGCRFESNVSGASVAPIVDISVASAGPPYGCAICFKQCAFTGFPGGNNKFPLHNSVTSISSGGYVHIEAIDCTGLALAASYSGIQLITNRNTDWNAWHILLHSPTVGGPFRFENFKGIVEYNPDASPAQPTFSATQPGGGSWSLHARWLATGAVDRGVGMSLPPIRTSYVASSAIRTIKLFAMFSDALLSVLAPGDVQVTISYVSDATGSVVTQTLLLPAPSTAVWTGAANWPNHSAREFLITTASAVRQGTEVVANIELKGRPRTAVPESVFFDPELQIT